MGTATLVLAAIGCLAVLLTAPRRGLLIYMAVLCWYSCWQPIVIGGVSVTAPRIVIVALLVQCLQSGRLRGRFRWATPDTLVVLLVAGELVAGMATSPLTELLQNRSGALLETALVYFTVRLIVVSREDYLTLLKGLLVIAGALAVLL